jgi:hypothetical protein
MHALEIPDTIHEEAEAQSREHEAALARGPMTHRHISQRARQILRAMHEGWKGSD